MLVPGSRPASFALTTEPPATISSNSSRFGSDCSEATTTSGCHSVPVRCRLSESRMAATARRAAAEFFAGVFGLPAPKPFYDFLDVELGNEVTLAFLDADGMEIQVQHYAFLVSEKEFDQIFGRIKERALDYWADPGRKEKGRINRHFGGRGVYFLDPSGHLLEIITKPYGSGG